MIRSLFVRLLTKAAVITAVIGGATGVASAWTLDTGWWLWAAQASESSLALPVDVTVDLAVPVAAWLEVTPLEGDAPPTVLRWRPKVPTATSSGPSSGLSPDPDEAPDPDETSWAPPLGALTRGLVYVCSGARGHAIACGTLVLEPEIEARVTLVAGLEVTGQYQMDALSISGARVAVVPADLPWARPFLMPLGPEAGASDVAGSDEMDDSIGLRRAVETDAEGRFRLPALSAGRYQLETVLPTGRVHHGAVFEVPEVDDARRQLGDFGEEAPAWDLGVIELDAGLEVSFEVVDLEGLPLAGAIVHGRQGTLPSDLTTFEARTNADGTATLGGFDIERPARLGCRARGFRDDARDHALLPVVVTCTLAPLGSVVGRVLGPEDLPPEGARVLIRRFAPERSDGPVGSSDVAAEERSEVLGPADLAPANTGLNGAGVTDADLAALSSDPDTLERLVAELRADVLGLDREEALDRDLVPSVAARLDADDGRMPGPILKTETLDSAGRFRLRGLDPGYYRLDLVAPGHATDRYELLLDASGTVYDLGTIQLLRGRSIRGQVVAADTGEPLVGAVVRMVEPPGSEVVVTDSDGFFELTSGDGEAVVLEASSDGRAAQRFPIARDVQEAESPITLPLAMGGRILAVVWDAATGTACVGCPVRVSPGGLELITDGDGEAMTELLAPGRYRVERAAVTHRGSVVVERPGAEIRRAQVRIGGIEPVWFGARQSTVLLRLSPTPVGIWYLSARGVGRTARMVPEADGAYRVSVEPGEQMSLYVERYDPASDRLTEVRVGHLALPEGDDVIDEERTLTLAGGMVRATVWRDGVLAARLPARLLALADRTLVAGGGTDDQGRLQLPHVPAGAYALEIDGVPARMISVGPDEELDLGRFDLFPRR